uniref:protein-glutamine gamma-glutamyltransferase n=1 Tax=Otus sunia TaxID=257818 RepID=A0A8C8AAG4_9STRI
MSQVSKNARDHHTSKFSSKELIVRRGQAFIVTFNGTEQPEQNLTFIAETGMVPNFFHRKTNAAFKESWSAVLQSTSSNSVSISISSPPNAVIGRYKLSVQTTSIGSSSPASLGTFVLLFNPWSSAECEEYVLEEFGIIFAGNKNHISSFGWNFGQFQGDILNICLSMLDRSLNYRQDPATDVSHRNDPKYLGRVLSAMVNANDDQGVLLGNWSGNYEGGKSPSSWTGSGEILQNWKKSGFKPVKYGQCWVFAAVLTTVALISLPTSKCLGIPTRTITNFSSAHDADGNLRVDEFYDASGNHLDRAADSIWNFHVWNESWFSRSDLDPSYSGWQVLDATPQEESGGIYQCGPASRNAIKEGDVDLDYDCPFVFAEVNADCMYWNYDPASGKKTLMFSESTVIGQFISTKAVGKDDRVDVTNDYKYEEEKQFPIKIPYTEYQQQLTTDNTIQVTALCHVEGGIQVLVQRDITLDNPAIDIQVLGEAKVNKEVDVEVIFTNPIDTEVMDCVLQVEGNDLLRGILEIDSALQNIYVGRLINRVQKLLNGVEMVNEKTGIK